ARRSLPNTAPQFHQPHHRGSGARGRPPPRGLHPPPPAPAPVRTDEEVLELDLYDRVEPCEERAPEPQPEPARALPDHQEALGGGPPAAAVRGRDRPAGRSVPQALSQGSGGSVRGPAAHPPPGRVRPP